jgi:urea transport system ATP-binding protein
MKFVDQLTQGRRKVTVLHEGRVLAEGLLSQVQNDDRVVEVYLGR